MSVRGTIGYHFEGATSLAVATEVAQLAGDAPTVADVPGRPAGAAIARHNPIPRKVDGRIRPISALDRIRSGDIVSIEVELQSDCDKTLEFDGLRPLRVCYRWLDALSRAPPIQREGIRSNLEGVRTCYQAKHTAPILP